MDFVEKDAEIEDVADGEFEDEEVDWEEGPGTIALHRTAGLAF